jgi:peptidyl-tRNA hydrolase
MYILMPSQEALPMTPGKRAAQAAHAAVEAYRISCRRFGADLQETGIVNRWYQGGHHTKIVLEASGSMADTREYIESRGFKTYLVIDEGRTEFGHVLTPTAIGVEIVDKDSPHVAATFSPFKLWNDPADRRVSPTTFERIKRALRS